MKGIPLFPWTDYISLCVIKRPLYLKKNPALTLMYKRCYSVCCPFTLILTMERKPLRAAQRHRLYTYIINSDPALAEVGPYLEKYGFIQYEQGNLIKSIEMGGAIAYNALRLYLGRDCDLMYSLLRTHEQNFRWVWVRSSGQVVPAVSKRGGLY